MGALIEQICLCLPAPVLESLALTVSPPGCRYERPIKRTSGRIVLRKIFTFSDLIPRAGGKSYE